MNKQIVFLLSLVLVLVMTSQGNTESLSSLDQPEIHGMLVFGEEEVYLSHLPMFHPPHNYQIILAANLGKDAESVYLESRRKYPAEKVYTLASIPFVLPDIVRTKKPFTATLYRGHFERGGVPIANDITVQITRVVVYEKLVSDEAKLQNLHYILFGNNREWYLAHQIVAAPDFDQIVAVTKHSDILERRLKNEGKLFLTILDSKNFHPLEEDDKRRVLVSGHRSIQIVLKGIKNYYLEFDDLAGK